MSQGVSIRASSDATATRELWPEFGSLLFVHMFENLSTRSTPKMVILYRELMINHGDPWGAFKSILVHFLKQTHSRLQWIPDNSGRPSSWGARLETRCFSMPQRLVVCPGPLMYFLWSLMSHVSTRLESGSRMHPTLLHWKSRPNSEMVRIKKIIFHTRKQYLTVLTVLRLMWSNLDD